MIDRRALTGGRLVRVFAVAALVSGAATVARVSAPAAAQADEEFAPASSAPIHPGVMVTSKAGQCTANFIFRAVKDQKERLFLGQAAHCTGTGNETETDGCKAKSLPLGTPIEIEGARHKGHLAYNSWRQMQSDGEKNKNACAYNDFALVEIDPADEDRVNPSVPQFGGPTGVRETRLPAGAPVYSYQNSSLRQGVSLFSAKRGTNIGDHGNGYSHEVATTSPGVPGDSGSGFLDSQGRAFGVLSTLNLQPAPGTNGVGDLGKELAYANAHGDLGEIELVHGTEPFRSGGGVVDSLLSPSGSGDKYASDRRRSGGLLGG
jgi:hypothetical protein